MKVGVTGTRNGMNDRQRKKVGNYLLNLQRHYGSHSSFIEIHHGDCVGVDEEVAKIAQEIGIKTVCHPPTDSSLRAWHDSDEVRKPLTYFARNRNIVDESEVLMVIPWENSHQSKGGTWYTHDYAVKKGKFIMIFSPEEDRPYPII